VGDEGGGEIHRIRQTLLPIADQPFLELIQGDRSVLLQLRLLHRGGEGGAERGAVGPGCDEAGAVGGILNRITEREQLFVAVEGGGKQRGAPGAGEAGGG
jgi:hypothetical protein